jgi:hypothetical protein
MALSISSMGDSQRDKIIAYRLSGFYSFDILSPFLLVFLVGRNLYRLQKGLKTTEFLCLQSFIKKHYQEAQEK